MDYQVSTILSVNYLIFHYKMVLRAEYDRKILVYVEVAPIIWTVFQYPHQASRH